MNPVTKILVVDDHVLFREGMVLLLSRRYPGTTINEAGSCEQALEMLEKNGPYDLVLMDLDLPGMSGMEGISAIGGEGGDTPVVALSGQDDMDTVLRAINNGAMGFIPKKSSSDTMVGAINLILMKGVYLPPSVFLRNHHQPPMPRPAEQAQGAAGNGAARQTTPAQLALTPRQADVLYFILQGKSAKAIGRELGLSANTVKLHTSAVLRALNVTTRTEAVIAAAKIGLRF